METLPEPEAEPEPSILPPRLLHLFVTPIVKEIPPSWEMNNGHDEFGENL